MAPADLVESAVSNPPASVRRGGHFTVTDTVKNQGGTAAGPSVTTYFLSSDPVKSAGDRALDGRRRVPALAPGASSTGSISVRVPAGTPRGTYFLLACTSNCRTAMTSVIIK